MMENRTYVLFLLQKVYHFYNDVAAKFVSLLHCIKVFHEHFF